MDALVVSMETAPVVSARARKLGVACLQGIEEKLPVLREEAAARGIGLDAVAYVGNDVNDAECLESRRATRRACRRLAGGARARELGADAPRRRGLRARVLRRCLDGARRGTGVTDELFDLSGRVAVVTGGLGQLGQVYTDGLAARGMRVAVFDVAAEPGGDDNVRRYAWTSPTGRRSRRRRPRSWPSGARRTCS